MEIKEAISSVLKDLIVPELDQIRAENREIRTLLSMTNKRLDDVNLHLADQSRRIDALREELSHRIDETNKRIDETNKRIDRLYDVVVRRDEHFVVAERVAVLEREVNELKRRLAA
jgi:septal ring factor EnvC (AmiA/AmiB activator)